MAIIVTITIIRIFITKIQYAAISTAAEEIHNIIKISYDSYYGVIAVVTSSVGRVFRERRGVLTPEFPREPKHDIIILLLLYLYLYFAPQPLSSNTILRILAST